MGMPIFKTSCPRNCYSTCSMYIEVEDGKIRSIETNPDNKATPEGICLKGLSYVERVKSKERLLYPLKRKSGTDEFIRISWDDALTEISENILRLKSEYGYQSILYYTGSGTKGLLNSVGLDFWKLAGGCTTTYGDLCWPAGLEAARLTLGENKHNAPWDLENARLIIMWGKNAAETNIHQMYFVEKALNRGAKLVVIDPRRTETSERAQLLIQPQPGTDGALALGICHLLINTNQVDMDFINQYVHGFEQFTDLAQEYSPEKVSKICMIPELHIHQLAEYIGTIKPMTLIAGYGMQRYTNSGQTIRALIAINALTGNLGEPGSGWQYANLQSHVFDPVKDPIASFPPKKPDEKIRVSISTAKLGQEIINCKEPPIKMIWVERGNPVTQNPDTNTVLEAFRSVDFRVVVDQFMTDTAREADIILPAKTFFEQSDIISAYWHPYIQFKQKIIDPPGEVKPESEIYYHLAKKIGIEVNDFKNRIPEPGDNAVIEYLKNKIRNIKGLDLDLLEKGPVLAPGHEEIAFADLTFNTPSGKIEIYSEEAKKRWDLDPLPRFTPPEETKISKNSDLFYFLTPNTKNRIHSQFNNLEMIKSVSPGPEVTLNPEDALIYGIKPNDLVHIFNERGEITLRAVLDPGLIQGCISVTNGWWISEGGTVNFCSLGRETDMGHGAAFHDNLVKIERVK